MKKSKCKRDTRFVSRVAVAVSGAGFIDMMRYDACYPATEVDAHKIVRVAAYNDTKPEDRIVIFTRVAANDAPPNEGRWRSFNCRVIAVQHPDDPPWTEAELLNLAKINGVEV